MRTILYVLLAFLLSSHDAFAVAGTNARTRNIDFPSRGLGKYFIDDGKSTFMSQWPEFSERNWAKGRVSVPINSSIGVETYWSTDDCLPQLRFLKPNDIQLLDVDGSVLTHAGVNYICKLVGLKKLVLEGTDADDRDVVLIARKMPLLQELNIGYTHITERALSAVSKMRELRKISLQRDSVTSSAVAQLGYAPNLAELNLRQTPVDDKVFDGLSRCKNLNALNLGKTRITDRGLAGLLSLRNLRKLDISECKISDASICSVIAKLENLEELNLSGTQVTDKGVIALGNLKHLRKLWLRDLGKVSDASIPSLITHSELRDLELQKTNISVYGAQKLAQALPKSEVHLHSLCKCRKQSRVN